jgi:hypothetical protein
MSQFEFITVAVSIVMALGVSRILDVIAPALRSPQRSWIHIGWVTQKFFNHVFWWWSLWSLRNLEWNLGFFVVELIAPVILYLQATALATPSKVNPDGWETRFFEIRVPFFLGNVGIVLTSFVIASFGGLPNAPHVLTAILGALALAGLATRQRLAHHLIVGAALLVQLVGFGRAFFEISSS